MKPSARVVGALALVIGVYYVVAATNELEPMLRASVNRSSWVSAIAPVHPTGAARERRS